MWVNILNIFTIFLLQPNHCYQTYSPKQLLTNCLSPSASIAILEALPKTQGLNPSQPGLASFAQLISVFEYFFFQTVSYF